MKTKETYSREVSSKGFNWLKKSFSELFEEYKKLDNVTKEKILKLENSIKEKFTKIEEEIDYKVGKWKCEMERGFKKVDFLYPIFEDFTVGYLYPDNYGKPFNEQKVS